MAGRKPVLLEGLPGPAKPQPGDKARHGRREMVAKKMTQVRAVEIAWKVCNHLGCRRPFVQFRSRGCSATGRPGSITVGPASSVDTVLHEVAHHLSTGAHGESFYQALLRVVAAAEKTFGHEYDWLGEYSSIRRRRIIGKPLKR